MFQSIFVCRSPDMLMIFRFGKIVIESHCIFSGICEQL